MPQFSILEAPSILGLSPTGVESLPEALLAAGLRTGLQAESSGRIVPRAYSSQRDERTLLLNGEGIKEFSFRLADQVSEVLRRDRFPVVLGGDCSILIGNLLALRRTARYGLFHIDGHADFYQPEAEPKGGVASMDLSIVTGRGPQVLTDIEGRKPLVHDEDVVQFGQRDAEEALQYGSQDIRATNIRVFDLSLIRRLGMARAAAQAIEILQRPVLAGFWLHLDVDVLDDAIMPAVDYRMPDGFSFVELRTLLRLALVSGRIAGMDVTIFNPSLDADGSIDRKLVTTLVEELM